MKRFHEYYFQADTKLLQAVAVFHEGIEFYASETLSKGWSSDLLLNAIKMDSYSQAQKQIKIRNFDQMLPETHADYANEVFKSTYNLGFWALQNPLKS